MRPLLLALLLLSATSRAQEPVDWSEPIAAGGLELTGGPALRLAGATVAVRQEPASGNLAPGASVEITYRLANDLGEEVRAGLLFRTPDQEWTAPVGAQAVKPLGLWIDGKATQLALETRAWAGTDDVTLALAAASVMPGDFPPPAPDDIGWLDRLGAAKVKALTAAGAIQDGRAGWVARTVGRAAAIFPARSTTSVRLLYQAVPGCCVTRPAWISGEACLGSRDDRPSVGALWPAFRLDPLRPGDATIPDVEVVAHARPGWRPHLCWPSTVDRPTAVELRASSASVKAGTEVTVYFLEGGPE